VVPLVACRHEAESATAEWTIVFVSDRDGEWATHAVSPDGSRRIRVAPNDGPGFRAAVPSPDGTQAILSGSRELRIVEAGRPGWRRLASGDPSSAAWSADAKEIVFAGLSAGLSVINVDGRNRQVTRSSDDHEATWSPDGRSIAFVRSGLGVLVVDRYGRRSRVLWSEDFYAAQLRWSADGRSLSFLAPSKNSVVTVSVATGNVLRKLVWTPTRRR
jgi:Tol biopolymer transport system component